MNLDDAWQIVIDAYRANNPETPRLIEAAYTVLTHGDQLRSQLVAQRDSAESSATRLTVERDDARNELARVEKQLFRIAADTEQLAKGMTT